MITAVVGAQFGSEAKGNVVGHIAGGFQVHVRVGAANAGHTVYVDGDKHVLQQLPCAAYANPWAKLVLGAGAMISGEVLAEEIEANVAWRILKSLPPLRLYIDKRAHAVHPDHIAIEQASGLAERIGSTSTIAREGIGAAQAARVMRTGYRHATELDNWSHNTEPYITWCDTVELLHDARVFDIPILLEGTQGTGLSNITGSYPFVTSRCTTAAGLAADCGLGPRDINHVILVARTYPIRVAGPSGPFWEDSREIDWADIGVDPEKERTTVTRKIRRVATFSYGQLKHAVRVNSATEIALTFADYLAPDIADRTGLITKGQLETYDYVGPLVQRIETETLVPVSMVATGPQTILDVDRPPPDA